jgi:RHS repeat-associated protein
LLHVPKRETSPVRYEFVANEDRWIEHLPDGNKRFYGASGFRAARIINELGTHEWLLLEERDPEGNTIEYDYYYLDDALHGQYRGAENNELWLAVQYRPVLKSVRWGGNVNGSVAHKFRVAVSVNNYLGDVDMMNGHVQNAGLVGRIAVFGPSSSTSAAEVEYWRYDLAIFPSVDTGRPLLNSVTESAAGATRRTNFSYSTNNNPFSVRPNESTCAATRTAAFGTLANLPTSDPEVYRSGGIPVGTIYPHPVSALSAGGNANAYQFRDMDADGDTDIAYIPAGLQGPAAQWVMSRSHQRGADGKYARFGTTSGLSIPEDLLITEFADVDGDSDPDAISFPLTPHEGGASFNYRSEYRFPTLDRAALGGISQGWWTVRSPLTGFRMLLSPPSTTVPLVQIGPRFCIFDPDPISTQSLCIPYFLGSSGTCLPLPDTLPTGPGQPPLDTNFEVCANGPREGCRGTTIGTQVCTNEGEDYRDPSGYGTATILIGANNARGTGDVRPAFIEGWPGLKKVVISRQQTLAGITPCPPGVACTHSFGNVQDFQAPASDLNGDGKADLLLLKGANSHLRGFGGAGTYFIPHAYLSDGRNFWLDWPYAPEAGMAVDVTSLTATTPAQLTQINTFRTTVMPALRSVVPGVRTLPTAWTDPMTAANRTALTQVLNSYSAQDASDEARVRALRSALVTLFEADLWARVPRPLVSLKKITDAWNAQLAVRALTRPALIGLAIPTILVPAVDVDLSPILYAGGNGIAISMADLFDVLARPRSVPRLPGQPTIDLTSLDRLAKAILDGVRLVFGLPPAPTAPRVGSFTWSARQILHDGRESSCVGAACKEGSKSIYPPGADFNALPLDLNGDGLPELVTAARPMRVPRMNAPGSSTTLCPSGHQVHINRGYRWDTHEEWSGQSTVAEAWSTPPLLDAEDASERPPSPLSLLQNRSGSCTDYGNSSVDVSSFDEYLPNGQVVNTLPLSGASFSDINADGRVDLVLASEVTRSQARSIEQRVFLNNGLGFRNGLGALEASGSCVLPPDFVFSQYNADTRSTLPLAGRSRLADIDSDGLLDLVYSGICVDGGLNKPCTAQAGLSNVAKWRRNQMKHPDLLTRVDEPAGAWTEVDYVAATSDAARGTTETRPGSLSAGYQVVRELRSGAQPVINPWANMGGETAQRITFKYDNYAREEGSTRAIGFEKVTATFANGTCSRTTTSGPMTCTYAAQAESTTTYDIRPTIAGVTVPHPLRGAMVKSRSVDFVRNAETETTQNYTVSPFGNAARVRATDSITATKDGGITLYTATQEREPDEYGFFKKTITGRSDALGQIVESAPETTVTTRTFKHVGSAWRLGRPATEATYGDKFDEFGVRTRALLAQSVTEYGADNRVSAHKLLLDGGPATGSDCWTGPQWSTTTFANYDLGQPKTINDNGSVLSLQYDAHKLYVALRSVNIPASASSPGALLEEDSSWDLRFGTIAYTNDANGRADTRMFDWQGRLVSHFGPGGDVLVNHRYDDRQGGPWTVTSDHYTTPTSFYSTWTAFDGYGRELASNKQVGATSGSTTPVNRVSRNRYDGLGRLVTSYQPVRLAALNIVALESTPLATTTAYDGFDRVLSETLPTAAGQAGRTIAYAYNNVSDGGVVYPQVTTTNLRKLRSERRFDANGSLISVRRFNADNTIAASYSYQSDGAGRMVSVSDSLGTRRVSFDEGGRLTHATLPRAANSTTVPTRVHSYCYDTRSKLISASTPEGRQVELVRDSVGRTAHISVDYEHTRNGQTVAEATTADFYYDCSVASSSLGRLCRQTDSASTTSIEYDNYGRADRYEVELAPAIADTLPDGVSNWYAIQLNYGLGGQLRESVVEGLGAVSQRVLYGHDIVGRTNNISLPNLTRMLVSTAAYDPFERLTSATLGNGVISSWDFDLPTGYLTAEKMAVGSSVFTELRYPLADHDENGNIKREQRLSLTQTLSEKTHTFNALDELATSRVVMNGAERKNERFTIAQGNLNSVVAGTATTTYFYEDPSNVQAVSRITAPGRTRTLSYDADGWVSRDVETVTSPATINEKSLTFDAGGCMREAVVRSGPQNAPQTTTTRNLCGFGGSRVLRETTKPDGQVERVYYLPDGSELRPEQNLFVMQLPVAKSTVATLAYSLTDGSLVQSESGYIHTDVRGSVVAKTPLNAANVRIPDREAEYDAWGSSLAYNGVATPRYQYTNEEPDPGTGYYYFGARPYDPTLRRWLAPDPLLMGSIDLDAYAAEQLNLYAYAANNPVMRTDKNGKFLETGLDIASFAMGVKAIKEWDADTTVLDKVLDVGGVIVDAVAIVTPLPGGAGIVRNIATKADDVADAAKVLKGAEAAKDATKVGEKVADAGKYRGGPHSATSKPVGDGLESHHMPADSVSDIPREKGPAIQMEPPDHAETMSHGSQGAPGAEFRAKQRELIEQGKHRDAMAREVKDVRRVAREAGEPRKYNNAMRQMLEYAKSLFQFQKDDKR